MGIDINGGMIVGAHADDLGVPEDFVSEYIDEYNPDSQVTLDEWAEEVGLSYYSLWYDAGYDGRVYGFTLKDCWSRFEIQKMMCEVERLMDEFEKITGVEAKLYGMQNVW